MKVDWDKLRLTVFSRDLRQAWLRSWNDLSFERWAPNNTTMACVATFLDPSPSEICSGRLTFDHVKDNPMMGRKAPDDEQHLVTLCWRHHIELSWGERHRPLERSYLRSLYGSDE